MAEIKATSPDMTATELKVIKAELLKQPSNKGSVRQTGQGCETERQDQTSHKEFEHACGKADEIYKLITLDPKEAVMSFVQGHIANLKNQAISAVKSFFQILGSKYSIWHTEIQDQETYQTSQ